VGHNICERTLWWWQDYVCNFRLRCRLSEELHHSEEHVSDANHPIGATKTVRSRAGSRTNQTKTIQCSELTAFLSVPGREEHRVTPGERGCNISGRVGSFSFSTDLDKYI